MIGVILIAIVVVTAFFFFAHEYGRTKKEKEELDTEIQTAINQLETSYKEALASGDKANALAAGRAYYGLLRRGPLTIYDEQALSNDLMTMRTTDK